VLALTAAAAGRKENCQLLIRAEQPKGSTFVMPLPVGDWRREIRAELRYGVSNSAHDLQNRNRPLP
jgi:hypothetical protein